MIPTFECWATDLTITEENKLLKQEKKHKTKLLTEDEQEEKMAQQTKTSDTPTFVNLSKQPQTLKEERILLAESKNKFDDLLAVENEQPSDRKKSDMFYQNSVCKISKENDGALLNVLSASKEKNITVVQRPCTNQLCDVDQKEMLDFKKCERSYRNFAVGEATFTESNPNITSGYSSLSDFEKVGGSESEIEENLSIFSLNEKNKSSLVEVEAEVIRSSLDEQNKSRRHHKEKEIIEILDEEKEISKYLEYRDTKELKVLDDESEDTRLSHHAKDEEENIGTMKNNRIFLFDTGIINIFPPTDCIQIDDSEEDTVMSENIVQNKNFNLAEPILNDIKMKNAGKHISEELDPILQPSLFKKRKFLQTSICAYSKRIKTTEKTGIDFADASVSNNDGIFFTKKLSRPMKFRIKK